MTGVTAGSKDFIDAMTSRAPIVFAFVLSLAFILLLVTFRSIVVPIKAIVLNLLSVGAAYGILVLVFQDGHGEKLLDFQSVGGIAPLIPLFLFVILFGLSMDYHVFILSRVREAVNRGMSNDDAVAHGLKSTAGVVTSAALVMVAVFGSFALGSDQLAKQIGVGLAAAILIDATIIRAVLLPATMKLLGERNWYLPKRLGWLPEARARAADGARPGLTSRCGTPAARRVRDEGLLEPLAGHDRRGERHPVVLRPGRAERCPGAAEDLVGPLAEQVGRLRLDVLGVVAVDLPAAVVGELGEQLAVHDRVGAGLVRRAALDGDVVGEVERPEPQRDRDDGRGQRGRELVERRRATPGATEARTCATSAAVAATSRRPLS